MRAIKISLIGILFAVLVTASIKAVDAISPLNDWINLISIPTSIASQSLFVYNSKIYVLGGSNFEVPTLGFYSEIGSGGLLSDWININQLPLPRYWHSYAIKENFIYLLGGADSTIQNINDTSLGNINDSTNNISWQTLNPLPQTLALGASVVIGDKLYFAGGNPTPTYGISADTNQNIYFASINSDGTINNWSIAGTLPDRLIGFGMLETNGYLYVFAGSGTSGYTANVSRAKVNTDGTVDSNWESLNSLPTPIWRFGITKSGNMIIIAGGQKNDGSITDEVYYSTLNVDGSLSNWESGPKLPYPNCCSPLVASGNNIYLIGGHDGGNYTDRVLMTKIVDSTASTPTPTQIPTSTLAPTPTSSPIPSITPTTSASAKPVNRVFLIPGIGASWNVDALMNCKESGYSGDWTLAPYAKSYYEEVLKQLPNHEWDTYPFYYDWRQDIRVNAGKLKNQIDLKTTQGEKVNIVGHSMGGLIGRNYIESEMGGKVSKFLAVGSPFQGSALSYPTFVKGQVWDTNLVYKIGKTLEINHCGVPSSIQNLLPTYNYIRDAKTKQLKNVSAMNAKNNYLPTNFVNPFWGVKVGTLSGTGTKTLNMLNVVRDAKWPDGKPVEEEYSNDGDGTVLLQSSQINGAISNDVINETHAGIIASTNGVSKILEFLGSPGLVDPPYVEPTSALVLVGYPGTFWLKDKDGNVTQSDRGMISILNPKDGDYQLQIIPQSTNTSFIVSQFLTNGKTLYKEYKFRGATIEPKIIHFNNTSSDEDCLHNLRDYQKPNYHKLWWFFWNSWTKHK